MKYSLTIVCLCFSIISHVQGNEIRVQSKIEYVTVFLSGAQITRTAGKSIVPGTHKLIFENLSPFLDEKSTQIKGTGDFTILSVNHRSNYSYKKTKSLRLDSLDNLISKKRDEISVVLSKLDILEESRKLLSANMSIGGLNSGVSMDELKTALTFYKKELNAISIENIELNNELVKLEDELNKLKSDKDQIKVDEELPRKEIIVEVEATQATNAEFNLTYTVANAGWFPKYDIRVDDINSPLHLNYKAEVYQNTEIPWDNVQLTFSNGNPSQSGLAPELSPWNLNFDRLTIYDNMLYGSNKSDIRSVTGIVVDESGEPIPGVNVLIKGTTIGTVTDFDGRYSITIPNNASRLVFSFIGMSTQDLAINNSVMNISMGADVQRLNEVAVNQMSGSVASVKIRGNSSIPRSSRAKRITTTTKQNQTTVEITADRPYSVKSKEDKLTIDLKQYELNANYRYIAVPKLDKDAFLIADIINWSQLSLLEGEANLYFEEGYVGRSIVSANALSDTLSLSLGRDKSIVIDRQKVDEFTKKRTVGSNRIETRGMDILLKNNKPNDIQIAIYDQLPKSINDQISVNPIDLDGAKHDESTGKLTWEISLKSSEQKKLKLVYDVRYPKKERVILE